MHLQSNIKYNDCQGKEELLRDQCYNCSTIRKGFQVTYLPTYVSLVWKEDSGKIRNWAAQSTFEKLFQMAFR